MRLRILIVLVAFGLILFGMNVVAESADTAMHYQDKTIISTPPLY
jgi:hypothetical protein